MPRRNEALATDVPATIPDRVALLRLDTDWYESTYHEMVHLYPRLAQKGVLILDDYHYWQGQRASNAINQCGPDKQGWNDRDSLHSYERRFVTPFICDADKVQPVPSFQDDAFVVAMKIAPL